MDYEDFVITLGWDGEGYRRDVVSPAGEWSGSLNLPLSDDEEDWQPRAGDRPSAAGKRGRQLFRALFAGHARQLYDESRGKVEARRHGLRLRLRMSTDLPELRRLGSLPWELVRPVGGGFLALSRETPIVRHPAVLQPTGSRRTLRQLRILAVMAEPEDQHPLGLDNEWDVLEEIWRAHPSVQLDRLKDATFQQLLEELESGDYDVLHFMGHGGFDPDQKEWVVCLLDKNGKCDPVKASVFGKELADFRRDLRLVVLNACFTARNLVRDPSGVAMAMVSGGLTSVVAMQAIISHRAAVEFSRGFYHRVAAGDPVEKALAAARKRIRRHERTGPVWPAEWATPVLFLRAEDGALFDVPPENAETAEPKSWRPSWIGLAALGTAGLGLALTAALGSLWVWPHPPLQYATAVLVVFLGAFGWLAQRLWVLYESKELTSDLSRFLAARPAWLGLFFALPLLALAGWMTCGQVRLDELRCAPLEALRPGERRIALVPWESGERREERLWASEISDQLAVGLRLFEDLQVVAWRDGRPAELDPRCIDATISGRVWQDRGLHLRVVLTDSRQQGKTFERVDQPDDLGGIDHVAVGLTLDMAEALEMEMTSEQCRQLWPRSSPAPEVRNLNRLGVLAFLQGDLYDAENRFQGALSLDRRYASAMNNLGRVLLSKEPADYQTAIEQFRRAVTIDPCHAVYYFNLGLALEKSGTTQLVDDPSAARQLLRDAVAAYEKAIEHDRADARAYNNLGFTLLELGELQPARASLELGRNLASEGGLLPYFEKNLGRAALEEGKPEKAIEHLERALRLRSEFPEALSYLAEARKTLGERNGG